ncbi:MAG: SgcJ/EcaC family oxidoreductase [Hyphomicrobiales bacterium]|nr:SgcJ/EcaC family oxidoreductase [Hyphomicrobiales bacterium]
MLVLARSILMALVAFVPTQILAAPADGAAAVFAKWKAAYDANDNVAVARLYTSNAILHGTRSNNVTVGRDAIAKYFMVVVNTGNKVEFREHQLMPLGDSTILVVGFNDFMRNRDGRLVPEPARFTIVLVKQANEWLIAHHHSSLRPPPPAPK